MNQNNPPPPFYLAPGAVSSGAMSFPGADPPRPPRPVQNPEDHLVEPETRAEMFQGERMEASPARPGHGDTHQRLGIVVGLSASPEYIVSTDLLTRHGPGDDFATDTCVRKAGIDPATGHRYLEELSFEVFHTQARAHAERRAQVVVGSGVRRMFGLFVRPTDEEAEAEGHVEISVEEWLPKAKKWKRLSVGDAIEDACLASPLPVSALIDAAMMDKAVVEALAANSSPALAEFGQTHFRDGKREGFRDGKREGFRDGVAFGESRRQREALLSVLEHRGIALTPEQRARVEACDELERLEQWFSRALSARSADELWS